MEVSCGERVTPHRAMEQERYTRSLRLPRAISHAVLHFDAHELHHMYPFVPGYRLREIAYTPQNEIGWRQWIAAARAGSPATSCCFRTATTRGSTCDRPRSACVRAVSRRRIRAGRWRQAAWLASAASRRSAGRSMEDCTFRGRPLFGDNKTARGFVVMVPATGLAFFMLALARSGHPGLWPLTPWQYLALGILAGAGCMLGELPNSFVKRQLGVAPGSPAAGAVARPVFMRRRSSRLDARRARRGDARGSGSSRHHRLRAAHGTGCSRRAQRGHVQAGRQGQGRMSAAAVSERRLQRDDRQQRTPAAARAGDRRPRRRRQGAHARAAHGVARARS